MKQLAKQGSILDAGNDVKPPHGLKKIWCQIVYDVKHDGKQTRRFVAGG
jgi:hypothetical protein